MSHRVARCHCNHICNHLGPNGSTMIEQNQIPKKFVCIYVYVVNFLIKNYNAIAFSLPCVNYFPSRGTADTLFMSR